MQRELKRGGQVYFLHNAVDTIERQAQTLAALIPEARVQVAHGQQRERDLADPAQPGRTTAFMRQARAEGHPL